MHVAARPFRDVARDVVDLVHRPIPLREPQQLQHERVFVLVKIPQDDVDFHLVPPVVGSLNCSAASALSSPLVGGTSPLAGAEAVVVGAGATRPSLGAGTRLAAAAALTIGSLEP